MTRITSVEPQGAASADLGPSPAERFLHLPHYETRGEPISGLQRALNIFAAGPHLTVDSVYGPITEGGVRTFLEASYPALARGDGYRRNRSTVRRLQRALNALGARLDVDGLLGEKTEAALAGWQRRQGETNPERLGKLAESDWDPLFVSVALELGAGRAERPAESVTRMSTRSPTAGLETPSGGVTSGASPLPSTTVETAAPQPSIPPRLTHEQLHEVDLDARLAPPADGSSALLQHIETKGATDLGGREITNPRDNVILLEQLLNAAEGRELPVTGEYTETLARRVLSFQKRYSLRADSTAGTETFEKALEVARVNTPEPVAPVDLTSPIDFEAVLGGHTLRLGDNGPAVAAVKRLIHELGIPVDLDAGDLYTTDTEAAVTDLQERLRAATGTPIGIDGIFGSQETLPNALAAWRASRSPEWQAQHTGDDGTVATWGEVNRGLEARNAPVQIDLAAMPSEADLIPRFQSIDEVDGPQATGLQRELQRLGYDIEDDGQMGPATRAAIADARDLYTILTGNELPEGIAGTRIALQHMLFPEGGATETHDPNAVTLLHTLPAPMREGHVRPGRGNTRVVVRQLAPDGVYRVNRLSGGEGMLRTRAALSFVAMRDRIRTLGMTEEFRSGWRSYEHQAYLRRLYARRGGVARPGHSLHHDGMEVDFVIRERGGFGWLQTNASRYGFSFPGHRMADGSVEHWAWTHGNTITPTVARYWRITE